MVDCGGLENRCTARYPGFESLSLRWKELQNKENPCKLILYGDFLFLVHSKNKHIFSLESSGAFMPLCPHCMYNGFIMNDLYDNGKKNALTYTLMPSLRFEVDFHIICLLSAIYSFL